MPTNRGATARRYLMCPPTHFAVRYRINPWMDPSVPVDTDLALRQWMALVETYRSLGHEIRVVDPAPGLPDMVFAANAAVVVDGRVFAARFRHPERRDEEALYHDWFVKNGFEDVHVAEHVNEGEGDLAVVGPLLLAGHGFRSTPEAAREAEAFLGRRAVPLRLVDERFYHLDTALAVLAHDDIAYFPRAFDEESQAVLLRLYPEALLADEGDALAFGLNVSSDGRHVVLPASAERFAAKLAARGYEPVTVDTSELQKSGGSVKCCTLELRGGR